MFDAAGKALVQMFAPPFRTVLLKSIGLALLLLIMLGVGLHRLLGWLAAEGEHYLEGLTGPGMQMPLHALSTGRRVEISAHAREPVRVRPHALFRPQRARLRERVSHSLARRRVERDVECEPHEESMK